MRLRRRSFRAAAGWSFDRPHAPRLASFGQTRLACDASAGASQPSALRCVSKHEGVSVLILRDARTRVRIRGSACACALLGMRTPEVAAPRLTVFGNSQLTMSNSHSRSRATFCARLREAAYRLA